MKRFLLCLAIGLSLGAEPPRQLHTRKCSLPDNLAKEVDAYEPVVQRILEAALNGSFKGQTYRELEEFVDDFGARLAGSEVLERSIDYVLERSRNLSLDNVHGEEAKVPHWVRGKESATLLKPREKNLAMLGLGYSVGTSAEGITAKAIVVKSFEELNKRASEVSGKIVVFNQDYVSYGATVAYRSRGASEAAKYGAVAALIRSITPYSINSPHTGMMHYQEGVPKIPAACITIEDAEMLHRLANRGIELEINLKMEAQTLPDKISRNVVTEVAGSSNPEKVVIVSGHIDSWDVGQGAMDDGGGAFTSWAALVLLKKLGLQPKRTVRSIMWTAEEVGIIGATQYIKSHKADVANLQLVMESDIGTFAPLGLDVTGTELTVCILKRIMSLLAPLGKLGIRTPYSGSDINEWVDSDGVPGATLWNANEKYFWYHHSEGDTMTVENPDDLDKITALFAAVSYIVADISIDLPRHEEVAKNDV